MCFGFPNTGIVDQRSNLRARRTAIANFQRCYRGGQPFDEFIMHSALHQESIGAYTGLPGVAELACHGANNGFIKVRVVEDNEWRMSAKFQGNAHHIGGTLSQENSANFCAACETHVANSEPVEECFGNGRCIKSSDDVEHTGRESSFNGKLCNR